MKRFLLFESGSTKTTLTVVRLDEKAKAAETFFLSGYNPNRTETTFFDELEFIDIIETDEVAFYGSGLGTEQNKEKLRSFFTSKGVKNVTVHDDLLAAARALFNNTSGIFAILGTGAAVGYYDGEKVMARKGGYGYLIDDLGGGYEMGKMLTSSWLNNSFSPEIDQLFYTFFQSDKLSFTSHYYELYKKDSNKALKMMAAIPKLIHPYKQDVEIQHQLSGYFQRMFDQHVLKLVDEHHISKIGIVGSIGYYFKEEFETIARENRLELSEVTQYPATELLNYHLKKRK
jgi:hypothetical protein